MRLWGRVATGISLVIAAVSALVAATVPETRPDAVLAAVLMTAVALVGIPALVRWFSRFTGDEHILENGTPGSATITALQGTGWRYNRRDPIVKFTLSVQAGGVWPVDIKQAVDPDVLERLAPGAVVAVRVDPTDRMKVVIDWGQPIRGVPATPADPAVEPPPGRRPSWLFLRWMFLIFGLVFLRLGCEAGYYEAGGVRTEAVVVDKTYSPGTTSTGGTRSSPSRHNVTYRFTTQDGRTIEGRADVLPGTWRQLERGGPVVVEYLPASPDTSRIPDQRARSRTWWMMAAVLLVGSGVLFIIGRRARTAPAAPGGDT
jgi:hypothetical protein